MNTIANNITQWLYDLFSYCFNFRDNVQWDEEQEQAAKEKVEQNSQVTMSTEQLKDLEANAGKHWDAFYDIHQNR